MLSLSKHLTFVPRKRVLEAVALASMMAMNAQSAGFTQPATVEELAVKTGKTVNNAPAWTKGGAFVYRISTPDTANVLPFLEQGLALTNRLLDGSIHQIPIINGLIGHDHLGANNWDGLWPYWDRVTFRAVHWTALHDFMQRVNEQDNTKVSFHVNLTDVNAGLRDYPESQAFFQKLVATKSIYCRDVNPVTRRRDIEPPYVLQEIPKDATDPNAIVSLVNYKNFWDSGLAREMIDNFYSHLPYAPPLLYLDVLTTSGGNFSTGFPDGPLGGSEQTQVEGILDIAAYLNSRGTSVGTEGDRPFLIGKGATYGWFWCNPGISSDDYSYIAGVARLDLPLLHVAGNTGCFDLSPIASTAGGLAEVRDHYARLLAGAPDPKPTPGLDTCHIAFPVNTSPDEFGTSFINPFRGDWADLINNFYLTGIQELYHIGKGSVRTALFNKFDTLLITKFGLVDPAGRESFITAADCAPPEQVKDARKNGLLMFGKPLQTHFNAPLAGQYQVKVYGDAPLYHGALNIYVNGRLQQTALDIHFPGRDNLAQPFPLGKITLNTGDNAIAFDTGPIYIQWSYGTAALWTTPYLRKGFKITNGDVTYADDYDRMWPDTWSGRKKIYFFSWEGSNRAWRLPQDWASVTQATLYTLTPDGRGAGAPLIITDRSVLPKLPPQVPCVLVPN